MNYYVYRNGGSIGEFSQFKPFDIDYCIFFCYVVLSCSLYYFICILNCLFHQLNIWKKQLNKILFEWVTLYIFLHYLISKMKAGWIISFCGILWLLKGRSFPCFLNYTHLYMYIDLIYMEVTHLWDPQTREGKIFLLSTGVTKGDGKESP